MFGKAKKREDTTNCHAMEYQLLNSLFVAGGFVCLFVFGKSESEWQNSDAAGGGGGGVPHPLRHYFGTRS